MEGVFERLFALESQGKNAHALVIHEGRLLYSSFGCELVLDLGKAWQDTFSASLPLGMNVISRSLSAEHRKTLGAFLKESCAFARKNKEAFIDLSQDKKSPYYTPLSPQDLSHYLDLYANETTECISQNDRNSFLILIQKSIELGLLHNTKTPLPFDWV
jgi:predicted solute-binding protein